MNKNILLKIFSAIFILSLLLAACGTPATEEAPAVEEPVAEEPAAEEPAAEEPAAPENRDGDNKQCYRNHNKGADDSCRRV